MADVAALGFSIDTSQVDRGAVSLGKLGGAADRAAQAQGRFTDASGRLREANGRFVAGAGQSAAAATNMGAAVDGVTKRLLQFVSVAAAINITRQIIQTADAYANLQGKLRLVAGETGNVGEITEQVYQISQRTYASLDATGTLVARTTRALVSSGTAQEVALQKSLQLSEAINNAFLVSGATAQESSNAVIQLSQGLAAGALRGEEFNSIAENGSRITQALAEYLGVTTGELRAMAAEGRLTAEVVSNALLSSFEKLSEEAAKMPVTVGRAMTLLENSVTMLIGQMDQASNGTAGLAGVIRDVALAIDIVRPMLLGLVELWAKDASTTDDATSSSMKIAEALQKVTLAVVLAKNVIDVLVDGFKAMVEFGIAGAEALIGTFSDLVDLVPQLIDAFKNPGNIGDNLANVVAEGLGRAEQRFDEFINRGADVGRDFQDAFSKNVEDVSRAFDFLLVPLKEIPESLRPVPQGFENVSAAAGKTEQEITKLANAQKAMADLLTSLRGELGPVEKVWATYAKALSDAEAIGQKLLKLGVDESKVQKDVAEAVKLAAAARERELAALRARQGAPGKLLGDMQQELRLLSMTTKERNKAVSVLRAEQAMREALDESIKASAKFGAGEEDAMMATAAAMGEAIDKATELDSVLSQLEDHGMDPLLKAIRTVGDALEDAFSQAGPPTEEMLEYMKRLQEGMGFLGAQMLQKSVAGLNDMANAMGGLFDEGSRGQKKMQQAAAALTVVQAALASVEGVRAIIKQGTEGDVYSAFARMGAMAAAVAPLIAAIGGAIPLFGGGGGASSQSAEAQQGRQGTGTVLGDAEAKSESILNAMEITADATSELVGINRGMLRALQTLESGINSASGMIARGGATVDVGNLDSGGLLGLPTLGLANMIFGGRQELIDQGIVIMGGALSDLINDITVGAYNTIRTDGGWFSSDDVDTNVTDITDKFGEQFQMIIASITNTVREGALALGILPAEIEAALAAFRVEEIKISLKDLSAEEQQAELQAVFSSIFDGLAGSVVPFIEQFQQLGEGLGETLVRVATSVQVTQEAMLQLGFALDQTDPETFAQIAVGLIEMTGGIDEFISSMQSFVSNFAPDSHKFAVAQDQITRAFAQFGLTIPATREGMWELMQSLDATTEEGREQIAMLLRLSGHANTYYDMLEDRAEEAANAAEEAAERAAEAAREMLDAMEAYGATVRGINEQLYATSGATEFRQALNAINADYAEQVRTLQEQARAAGMAHANTDDLNAALLLQSRRVAQLVRELEDSARSQADALGLTPLALIDSEIAALSESERLAAEEAQRLGDSLRRVGQISSDVASAMLGDFSPLSGTAKADYALRALQDGAIGLDAALQAGRGAYSSGRDFDAFFRQAVQIAENARQDEPESVGESVSFAMRELLKDQAALQAAAQAETQRIGAYDLAQTIADLSSVQGVDYETILSGLGIDLETFLSRLGFTDDTQLGQLITQLQAEQDSEQEWYEQNLTADGRGIIDAINGLGGRPLNPEMPAGKEDWGGYTNAKSQEEVDERKALRDEVALLRGTVERLLPMIANSTAATAGNTRDMRDQRGAAILEDERNHTRGNWNNAK